MIVAEMNTEHYTFHAIGETREQAAAGILAAMRVHSEQTGAWGEGSRTYDEDPDEYDFPEWAEYYGVNFTDDLRPGEGSRDWSRLTKRD